MRKTDKDRAMGSLIFVTFMRTSIRRYGCSSANVLLNVVALRRTRYMTDRLISGNYTTSICKSGQSTQINSARAVCYVSVPIESPYATSY